MMSTLNHDLFARRRIPLGILRAADAWFRAGCLTVLVAIGAVHVVQADLIDDASFFELIPHTLIDFETDGGGNPIILGEGASLEMPFDEYAAQGIMFAPAIRWVNDASEDFDAAQAIGGSLDIAIPTGNFDDVVISFLAPTRSFGFWVVNNNSNQVTPMFEARDTGGAPLETVAFSGEVVDGTIGIADYGFMGIAASADIGSVRMTKDATIFDNFYFSPVPEPSTFLLAAFGVLGLRALSCRRGAQ